jgi:hypothetical protein
MANGLASPVRRQPVTRRGAVTIRLCRTAGRRPIYEEFGWMDAAPASRRNGGGLLVLAAGSRR